MPITRETAVAKSAARIRSPIPDADQVVWVISVISRQGSAPDEEIDALCAGIDLLPEFGAELVLLGDVVECAPKRPDRDRMAIVAFPNQQALAGMQSRQHCRLQQSHRASILQTSVTVECGLMDVPNDMAPAAAENLDHVVNIITYEYADPQVIEDYLILTRGLAVAAGAQREAWFEVKNVAWGNGPAFDEVFVSRYPSVAAWCELRKNETWWEGICNLRANLPGFTEMLIKPSINRIAETRPK